MNTLAPDIAAYIAGLVDADGTISLSRKHANEHRHPVVSISNTNRSLLSFVLESVAAGKITSKRTQSPRHNPGFTYSIYNRQALELITQLHPYLRTYKAQRAKLIIEQYLAVTPRNGKYTKQMLGARRLFEEQVLALKPGDHPNEASST